MPGVGSAYTTKKDILIPVAPLIPQPPNSIEILSSHSQSYFPLLDAMTEKDLPSLNKDNRTQHFDPYEIRHINSDQSQHFDPYEIQYIKSNSEYSIEIPISTHDSYSLSLYEESTISTSVQPMKIMIEGYDIIKILGAGAFGTVAHVKRQQDGANFVIKILPKLKVKRSIYENETNILQQIQPYCSEYLLCYMGTDETTEYYIIFLEYLEGYITLYDFLKQLSIIDQNAQISSNYEIIQTSPNDVIIQTSPNDEIIQTSPNDGIIQTSPNDEITQNSLLLTIVNNLSLGLKKLHSLGIAHRDIKSNNIMISDTGEVKFIDFGLSCDLSTCNKQSIFGTITFLAPEMITQQSFFSLSEWQIADLWSLGMVIYNISNLKSYPDEVLNKLRSISFMRDITYKHVVSYILGVVVNGEFNWMATLKWKHPMIISILTGLLQVNPTKRYIINF
ncbi:Protein kinase [uncultured virus]|nr:Protein kinase [uncultured virus]